MQVEAQKSTSTAASQAGVAGTAVTGFNGRLIPEMCAMGSFALEEFTRSVACKEIVRQGRQEGEFDLPLVQFRHRYGDLRETRC